MDESLPPIPVLLKEARAAYGSAIRQQFSRQGLTPLPPNGAFVVGALHWGASLDDIMRERGTALEKGQVLERLITAGVVIDGEDGLVLTDTGHDCAHAVYEANSSLTNQLIAALGDEGFGQFLTGLMTLIDIKEAAEEA
jgi:hypothetical protein